MKTHVTRLTLLALTVIVLAFLPSVAHAAPIAQEAPPVTGPAVAVVVLDVVFLTAITAFIKKQFELSGRPVMMVAFGAGFTWASAIHRY